MPTTLLNTLMNRAGGWRSLPDPKSKSSSGEGKDPNIAAILAQGKDLAKDQNVAALEQLQDEFKALGLGPTYQVLLKSARTPTQGQIYGRAVGDVFLEGLRGLGILPQSSTAQSSTGTATIPSQQTQQLLQQQISQTPAIDLTNLPEGVSATMAINAEGKPTYNLSFSAPTPSEFRKKVRNIRDAYEMGVISKEDAQKAIRFAGKALTGDTSRETLQLENRKTGVTTIIDKNENGDLNFQANVVTDYTGEERQQMAIQQKLAQTQMGTTPEGKPYAVTNVPGQSMQTTIGEQSIAENKPLKELTEKYQLEKGKMTSLSRQWDFVHDEINRAITTISPVSTGFGSWLSVIPETESKKLAGYLQTIKANIGFDKLQELRNNSKTGGALGQVSDLENQLLQSVQGAIDQSITGDELIARLLRVRDNLERLRQETETNYKSDFKQLIGEGDEITKPSGTAGPTMPSMHAPQTPEEIELRRNNYLKRRGLIK